GAMFLLLRRRARHREQGELQCDQRALLEQSVSAALDLLKKQEWANALAVVNAALALAATYDPSRQAELYYYKGYVLEQMKQFEQAMQAYSDCQSSETVHGERKHSLHSALRQGYLLTQLQRWSEAAAKLQQVIDEVRGFPIPELHLYAVRILLGVYQAMGDYKQVLACAQEGLRVAHHIMDEAMAALLFDLAGDAYLALDQPEEALQHYEQSLDLYRKLGHTSAALMVKRDIGQLYQACADWDKALAWLQTCLWASERQRDKHGQAHLCYDIACLHISKGDLEAATEYLQQSMALFRQAEDKAGVDQVGRTFMGLSILMQRRATAGRLTFRDIERGLEKEKKKDGE
ncbi:MAG: hypothetical protein H5T63_05670, partial [Chloroflexi bacterium]|nr:hypothetical protein [Chloroflexota bacterium]